MVLHQVWGSPPCGLPGLSSQKHEWHAQLFKPRKATGILRQWRVLLQMLWDGRRISSVAHLAPGAAHGLVQAADNQLRKTKRQQKSESHLAEAGNSVSDELPWLTSPCVSSLCVCKHYSWTKMSCLSEGLLHRWWMYTQIIEKDNLIPIKVSEITNENVLPSQLRLLGK